MTLHFIGLFSIGSVSFKQVTTLFPTRRANLPSNGFLPVDSKLKTSSMNLRSQELWKITENMFLYAVPWVRNI